MSEAVRAWAPPVAGIREVFHARFVDYAYPPHVHDSWTILIVDRGGIRFDLDCRHHGTGRDLVAILPPHVVHDGRAAGEGGFHKRVLYLDETALPRSSVGRAVDAPALADRPLRIALAELHRRLDSPIDSIDVEARLALVVDRLRRHLGPPHIGPAAGGAPGGYDVARSLRDLLDAGLGSRDTMPSLGEAAAAIGVTVPHAVREFSRRFGVSPHRYVTGRRVDAARSLLLAGMPPAGTAAAVGFYDQAHLTRHFVRFVGTTPGRFSRARRGG